MLSYTVELVDWRTLLILMNLIQVNAIGQRLSKLAMFQNQEMIYLFPKLTIHPSLFSEVLLKDLEQMNALLLQKLATLLIGNKLAKIVHLNHV